MSRDPLPFLVLSEGHREALRAGTLGRGNMSLYSRSREGEYQP
jgi:hypothetical protein